MTRMTSEQFSRQWEIARRICNYKIHNLLKPTIAGGAAIDTYLKRECKDFDVYFPECLLEHFDVSNFCTAIGLSATSEVDSGAEVINTSKEYGECTLRYIIKDELLGAPVHIEIITWKPATDSTWLQDIDSIKSFIANSYTPDDLGTQIISTFSVNTSMSYFLGTYDGKLVLQVPNGLIGFTSPLRRVEVYDLTSALMDKSLVKYDQYCGSRPFFFDDEEKAMRSKSMIRDSTKQSFTKLGDSLLRIASFPYDYKEGSLEQEEPAPFDRRDPSVSTDITTWNLSGVREGNTTGASVPRPRPLDWVDTVRAPQELQPARVEAPQPTQEIWSTAFSATTSAQPRGRMDGFVAPPHDPSRPPHWV